ncbi:rhomboid family intramembrane serine protease [Coraliomargarita sp. SDUM461003]|uniref:Rhomboid family intramembrane serine protease n=1 Tax=Thalassobacterium maritimum TaxID=3041265 RepID=A0ABU1AT64_9BACT|nr:rhomboid family intramembrane serine protease [Coraliomargarita sp. SDUM461003]MDQ8206182.1 rhomboid family intramembrane serine protease [Coraliomargarita sp. SDUM461003]
MNTENKTEQSADLRWPDFTVSLRVGFFVILALSAIMALLQLYLPAGNGNSWLVIQSNGLGAFPEAITAIVSTHFFHASWEHLWINLGGLWIAGLIAFSLAGYQRALMAMVYGGLLAGIVFVCVGAEGTTYLGASPLVYGFVGLIIPSALRKGMLPTLLLVIGLSVIGKLLFDSIRDTAVSAEYGVVWLGYFCGLMGGFMADLNNPTEAVRVLHKKGFIDGRATEALLRETCPELYIEVPDYEEELMSAAEEIVREKKLKKQAVEEAIRAKQEAKEKAARAKRMANEDEMRAKKSTKDEAIRKKQEIKDAKLRARQLTKDAKRQAKFDKKQRGEMQ